MLARGCFLTKRKYIFEFSFSFPASSITAMVSLFIESLLFWILIDITKRYYYRGGGEDLLLDRGFTTKSEDIRRGCRDTVM